jgi:uncharacterized protein (DUF58 family)
MAGQAWWALLILLTLVSLVTRSSVLAFLILLLALASAASLISLRYGLRRVRYRRRFEDDRVFPGEETGMTIEVRNDKPFPVAWLLVRDPLPEGLTLVVHDRRAGRDVETSPSMLRDLLVLRWYESVERTYRLRAYQRGVYAFEGAELASGSLFGLDVCRAAVGTADQLIVYPKVVPVEALGLPFERPAGPARARRPVVEDPLRMASVREYVPGDSIRHIHWKNTAHRDQLQTKVYDPQASEVIVLYPDLQTTADPYVFISEYLELILSTAASLAVHALEMRWSVGLVANGGPPETNRWTHVAPSRHPRQGAAILEALAVLDGFRTLALSQLLGRTMVDLPYGSTVVVVTARTTEPLLLALLSLRNAGHPVMLLTIGERRPWVPEQFRTVHLGGRDAWHRLDALALA